MLNKSLTASEVCAAADCPPSTLRAWRNRNGLFADDLTGEGWTRFDFAQAIGVRITVLLTQRGFAAQQAVDLVNGMRDTLTKAARGYPPLLGIARKGDTETLEFRKLEDMGRVADNLRWFTDPVVIVLNLNAISLEVLFAIREQRALGERGAD
ncbi:MerR family transcriptional regulator [Methylocella sp.]|jgi:DNA-binding transcriptional MerR regulator|uniref:MerR family transcriptional regulator n=1 Tax=Methylocella sp. TaxID=1978226 RepID=UPI003C173D27